eukprot:6492730-Amphidinium_carterae.10
MLDAPIVHPPSGPGSDRGGTARMRHALVMTGALGALPSVDEDHTCIVFGDPVWDRDQWDPSFERS